jgi:hypothetical protein
MTDFENVQVFLIVEVVVGLVEEPVQQVQIGLVDKVLAVVVAVVDKQSAHLGPPNHLHPQVGDCQKTITARQSEECYN